MNIVNDVKQKALKRGLEWLLQPGEAYALITSPCHYCGSASGWPESRNGIDRVDNAVGYTVKNTVSCCRTCNTAKGTKTVVDFVAWVEKVHAHLSSQKGN